MWVLNLKSNLWTWIGGNNVVNSVGSRSTLGVPSAFNIPSRRDHSMIYTSNILFIYGGSRPSGGILIFTDSSVIDCQLGWVTPGYSIQCLITGRVSAYYGMKILPTKVFPQNMETVALKSQPITPDPDLVIQCPLTATCANCTYLVELIRSVIRNNNSCRF